MVFTQTSEEVPCHQLNKSPISTPKKKSHYSFRSKDIPKRPLPLLNRTSMPPLDSLEPGRFVGLVMIVVLRPQGHWWNVKVFLRSGKKKSETEYLPGIFRVKLLKYMGSTSASIITRLIFHSESKQRMHVCK